MLIKDIKHPLVKLRALEEIGKQDRKINEESTISSYSDWDNTKEPIEFWSYYNSEFFDIAKPHASHLFEDYKFTPNEDPRPKMVKGAYYAASNGTNTTVYKWGHARLRLNSKDFNNDFELNELCGKYFWKEVRFATQEEIDHINACIEADEYVEPGTKKHEYIGKWLQYGKSLYFCTDYDTDVNINPTICHGLNSDHDWRSSTGRMKGYWTALTQDQAFKRIDELSQEIKDRIDWSTEGFKYYPKEKRNPMKNELKTNTWYIDNRGKKQICYRQGVSGNYGVWLDEWRIDLQCTDVNIWKEATEAEVKEVLVAEAKRRGLWYQDNDFICAYRHALKRKHLTNSSETFSMDYNRLWSKQGCVFYNGKWATVVKDEEDNGFVVGDWYTNSCNTNLTQYKGINPEEPKRMISSAIINVKSVRISGAKPGLTVGERNQPLFEYFSPDKKADMSVVRKYLCNMNKEVVPELDVNQHGLKIGQVIPAEIVNAWCVAGLNEYFHKWQPILVKYDEKASYIISSFDKKDGVDAFIFEGMIECYVRAEGFKEFMDKYLEVRPQNTTIIGNNTTVRNVTSSKEVGQVERSFYKTEFKVKF